jgi:FAD-dependent urate hydroxylase
MSSSSETKVEVDSSRALIVGVGVAGPALGIALGRSGIRSAVFEECAAPRDRGGAFLNVAPNGIKVLEALGLENRVEELGFVTDRLVFHNDRGRVLSETAAEGVTILRGVLSRALREAAMAAGVTFVFGKQVEWIQERDGTVTVAFADGTAESTRLLVGADGVHSRVRRGVFPDAPKPTYTGVVNLGGVVHTDLPPTGTAMHLFFGKHAFFGYAVRRSGETYWFTNYALADEPLPDSPAVVDAATFKEQLLELHASDPPEISHILNAVTERIGIYPIYDMPVLPSWHSRSVCLIGDAAHALGPNGQGASLALEDAFMLAKCLHDVSEPSSALDTFERLRRDRVERASQQKRRSNGKGSTSGIGRKIRDLVLPRFLQRGAAATLWMYGYPADWDEPIGAG